MSGLISGIVSNVDMLLAWLSSGVRSTLKDYCVLSSASDVKTLIAEDGSCVSVLMINGSKKIIGDLELDEVVSALNNSLQPAFQDEGHQLQFVFNRNSERIEEQLKSSVAPYRQTAKNLGLSLDDMFTDKINHLKTFCSYEECFMVVWSRPSLITETIERDSLENMENSKEIPLSLNAQNLFGSYVSLKNKHAAFLRQIFTALEDSQINYQTLDVIKACRKLRQSLHHKMTANDWEPILPYHNKDPKVGKNDMPPIMAPSLSQKSNDFSHAWYPMLSEQLFPADIDIEPNGLIKLGSLYYASCHMTLPPKNILPFAKLFASIDMEIPWQLSVSLSGGALVKTSMKKMAATLLQFSNAKNKLVKEALEYLSDVALHGGAVVSLKINALTWSTDPDEVLSRQEMILKSLQSWGVATFVPSRDDPVENFLATQPAFLSSTGTPAALAPLTDILPMLPILRPSHVWETGAATFRTEDGKLFPFQPGSSHQTAWNEIIFAKPGSGKSVLMNAMNLATILTPGSALLPFVGIIDIGPSSSGLIQLIRDALPEKDKDKALYKKLKNNPDYAINVFDTHLGSRYPTEQDRLLIVNFLSLVMTPVGENKPYASSDTLAMAVVDEIYNVFSDSYSAGKPKEYTPYILEEVDETLKELGFDIKGEHTWWSVVDFLFKHEKYREASAAQRLAVPTIQDCISVARQTPSIKDLYEKPLVKTGENLLDFFTRSISESVKQYPILAHPTKFDVSDAHILSLDLDEVAKAIGASATKQTGLMYMLARFVIGRKYFLDKEFVKNIPQEYRRYHLEKIKAILGTKKRICFDEFHRTSALEAVKNQVVTDQREGRKWNIQVVLSSQVLEDFPDQMVKIANGVYIMSGGLAYREISSRFSLSTTERYILKDKINGPSSAGAPFLYIFNTKKGNYSKFLYSTVSSVELWAFSTTSEDVQLRTMLTEKLDAVSARQILAKEFPSGTAKEYIEKLMEESGKPALEVMADLMEEIIQRH